MLGAEHIAEVAMLLSLGVEELVEARSIELAERVCRVAVEALCEQHYHLGISGMGFGAKRPLSMRRYSARISEIVS
jgi:hypothetical protein